jgi:TatD DNase family protein
MSKLRLFDIAANLSDKSYQGIYNKRSCHAPDIETVLSRARSYGVSKFLLAGGNLKQSRKALSTAQPFADCFCTVGVHPCLASVRNIQTVTEPDYSSHLSALISECGSKCIAVGECGLDYDRLHFADKESQLKAFPMHFDLAQATGLPLYLHSRNTNGDFTRIVRENRHKFSEGVVHSFTGDVGEMREILELGLYIGINGCSMKTAENVEVVRQVPIEKMMIETDCPYCEIRKSSPAFGFIRTQFSYKAKEKYDAGFLVRGRNEPCTIV